MAWSKPFTDVETAYVEAKWGQLSATEIAEKLGRSRRGVETLAKRLGLTAPCARVNAGATPEPDPEPAREPPAEPAENQEQTDELEDLRWLRRQLRRQLVDAGPQSAPKLAKEFRETIEAIRRVEADDGDGGFGEEQEEGQGVLSSIFAAILPARGA